MSTVNPWQYWTAEQLATATGCPIDNIRDIWPRVVRSLSMCGIADRPTQIAMAGTIAIETASTFLPVKEAFWLDEEWRRKNLRYYPYFGRGIIQLTWESNYATYGRKVNELWGAGSAVDLVARPDDALDPDISAAVSALYFRDHGGAGLARIPEAARIGDWSEVRRLVQGGSDGLDRLVAIASALDAHKEPAMPGRVTFDPTTPTELQVQDWTCSIRSVMWLLKSIGIPVTAAEAQDAMAPRYVNSDVGLLDASGAGIVAVLRDHWDMPAENVGSASFELVAQDAGRLPIAIGLRNWGGPNKGHWSAVRGFDGVRLVLANPGGTGPVYGQQTLTRAEFDARGPASMVRLAHPDLVDGPSPKPTLDAWRGVVGSGILEMMAADGTAPIMPSTWLPLGRGQADAEAEEGYGENGTRYVWHLPTGRRWRYPAA